MSTPTPLPLLRDFPDWHSPMVVKEMRHGLRTRFFTGALILLHTLLAMLMVSALLGAEPEVITQAFWGITMTLLLGVMPLRGFAALTAEAQEGTLEMLTLTGISASRIVYGKWAALFSQTLLVASSLLPYMIARYFFGGIEIPREMAALALLVLGSALSTAALVGFSSQRSILLRLFLLAGVAIVSISFASVVLTALIEGRGDVLARDFIELHGWEQIGLVVGLLMEAIYGVYVFLSLGASRIASSSENHSTAKRLVAFGAMGIFSVAGCGFAVFYPDLLAFAWTFMASVAFTILVGVDVMTEAMPSVSAVAAPFVTRGRFVRMAGRLLYPGWASGVVFYLALCSLLTVTIACRMWKLWGNLPLHDPALAYLMCLLTTIMFPVCVRMYQKNRFVHWWVVQMVVFTLAVMLLAFIEVTGEKGLSVIGLMVPGTAFVPIMAAGSWNGDHSKIWMGVAGIDLLWTVIALFFAVREMRTYRRLEAEVCTLQTPPGSSPLPSPHEPA